jgi:Zn-dependent metalloprotease
MITPDTNADPKGRPAPVREIDPRLGVVRHLRGEIERLPEASIGQLESALADFVVRSRDLFGDVNLERAKTIVSSEDKSGGRSITLQQYHGAVRVYGGSVRFHVRRDGMLDAIDNRLVPNLRTVPQEPKVSADAAIKRAQVRSGTSLDPDRKPELLVYTIGGVPRLVWEVQVRGGRKRRDGLKPSWVVLVDAVDNKVLDRFDNTQTMAASTGQGTGYYSGSGAVNTFQSGALYQLRDTTRTAAGGSEIRTLKGVPPALSQSSGNLWNDLATDPRSDNQGAEVDCHRYVGQALDYFTRLGRPHIDQSRSPIDVVVHASEPRTGLAVWSGARWNPDLRRIEVGDGDGQTWDYLCAADWMAHELTHAFIQDSCNLQYRDESGALNESICDTFAAFITGSWSRFAETWKPQGPAVTNAPPRAYRNLADPNNGLVWKPARPRAGAKSGSLPDHYSKRYKGSFDNRGVHINSTIPSHAVYLLSEGGTHAISQISVRGVGKAIAERMLFECMNRYLVGRPTASFADLRLAMLDAAMDEYPGNVDALLQTKRAFNAVGIGPALMIRTVGSDSPDIIVRGQASANPGQDFADLSNLTLSQPLKPGANNFAYVRVQNRGTAAADITVTLHMAPAGSVNTPASWTLLGTAQIASIADGGAATAGPFVIPAARIPAAGPVALIASAGNAYDPVPRWASLTSPGDVQRALADADNVAAGLVRVRGSS